MSTHPLLDFALTEPASRRRGGVQATSVQSAREESVRLEKREREAVWALDNYLHFTSDESPTSLELSRWFKRPVLEVRIGLSDAKRHGLVENGGKRKCTMSGKVALTWRLRQR